MPEYIGYHFILRSLGLLFVMEDLVGDFYDKKLCLKAFSSLVQVVYFFHLKCLLKD